MNAKVFLFWAGNQYDVRYFFPYVSLLGFLAAYALNEILSLQNSLRIPAYISYFLSGIFSICMGCLGLLSMYLPSLTGERRIFFQNSTLLKVIQTTPFSKLWHNMFMNQSNFIIGFCIYLVFGLTLVLVYILKKQFIKVRKIS